MTLLPMDELWVLRLLMFGSFVLMLSVGGTSETPAPSPILRRGDAPPPSGYLSRESLTLGGHA